MNLDFDTTLSQLLQDTPITMGDPGASVIVAAGRRRLRRRRAAYSSLVTVSLVSVGGVAAYELRHRPTGKVITASAPENAAATTRSATTVPTAGKQRPATASSSDLPVGSSAMAPAAPLPSLPKSTITWERVPSAQPINGPIQAIRNVDGTFLAIVNDAFLASRSSVVPSQTMPANSTVSLLASTDGINWKPVSLPNDIALHDALSIGGSISIVGMAGPSTVAAGGASSGDIVVAVSKDGDDWTKSQLPIDLRSLAAKGAQINVVSSRIVRQGSVTLVAVTVDAYVDVSDKLPGGVLDNAGGFAILGNKVVVYDAPSPELEKCVAAPQPLDPSVGVVTDATVASKEGGAVPIAVSKECQELMNRPQTIKASYTFTELGVDPAVVAAIGQHTHMFRQADGSAFTPISLPAPDRTANGEMFGTQLAASASGFLVARSEVVNDKIMTEFLQSADGAAWSRSQTVEQAVTNVGVLGQRTILGLESPGAGTADLSAMNADGSIASLGTDPAVAVHVLGANLAIGNAGLLAVSRPTEFGPADVSFEIDGITLTVTTTDRQVVRGVDTTTGTVVIDNVELGTDSSPIPVKARPGHQATTIPQERLFAAMGWAQQAALAATTQLLDSPDGKTWASTSLATFAGLVGKDKVIGVTNTLVTNDRYIVNLATAPETGDTPNYVTLVGRRA